MKKFSITTKTGDQGFSRLFSGEKVLKNSPRLDAYGDLDELVSLLSVARHHVQNEILKEDILFLQRDLFKIASELATTAEKLTRLKTRVDHQMLQTLEDKRMVLEEQVEIPKGFVIPGGNSLSASYLDLARCIARRCERKIVGLLEEKEISNTIVLVWFNRLSDYLYLLARFEEKIPLLVKKND